MFASARVDNIMDYLSFALNVSPLCATTSLEKLGYQCKVNQKIIDFYYIANIGYILYNINDSKDRLSNQDNNTKTVDKNNLINYTTELIINIIPLFNFNWNFIIIANLIINLIKLALLLDPNFSKSATMNSFIRLLIIIILRYWDFSNTAQLCVVLSYNIYLCVSNSTLLLCCLLERFQFNIELEMLCYMVFLMLRRACIMWLSALLIGYII